MRLINAATLVAIVAFAAYVPVLDGDFTELDDSRFIRDNPAVHRLDPGQVLRFFTDPSTLATVNWKGTYRPLRTLDFAIDWAVSGGRPWFFHLRNVLYHVLGSLLVLAIFSRLSGRRGPEPPALLGALLFAVHPVQTEAVAWITSRGDGLLAVTFLLALLLHISGRRLGAALVLTLALFSKESAVVFFAVALLADLYRRAPPCWRWYGLYAGLAGAYLLLWIAVQPPGVGHEGFGHHGEWWGGSYGANLLVVARALLLYAGLVVLPVRQVVDYFVPMTPGFDLGAALGILLVLLAAAAAWRCGRRVRFAALWFAVTLLPTLNLLFTVGTPATERFLYLPLVGPCLLSGHLLARAGSRLVWVPLLCLLLLTLSRTRDWRHNDRLMESTRAVAVTQVGHLHLAIRELDAAREARDRGDREEMRSHAEAVVHAADELFESFTTRVGNPPAPLILVKKSNALLLLERNEEALATAERAIALGAGADAHHNAAKALDRLGREEEAADHVGRAIEKGHDKSDLRPAGAHLLNFAAGKREASRKWEAARRLYRRSRRLFPDPVRNAEAFKALERLGP